MKTSDNEAAPTEKSAGAPTAQLDNDHRQNANKLAEKGTRRNYELTPTMTRLRVSKNEEDAASTEDEDYQAHPQPPENRLQKD